MLGNMEKFGLLPQPNDVDKGKGFSQFKGEPVFIEFGAGRGYLTHMLADCYDAKKLIFIDRRPYKFKVLLVKFQQSLFCSLLIQIFLISKDALSSTQDHSSFDIIHVALY